MDWKTPLQRLREKLGLTLQDVAAGTDIDTGNLSRIESGRQKSLEAAETLVKFFRKRGEAITELEILYPERYPPTKQERERGARVARA